MLAVIERMSDTATDDALMARIQGAGPRADREAAFRDLVARHAASVQGFARSILGRAEGAEDVTQDVFLRVYLARERYEPGRAAFRTWLLRIARNRALNARRDRARRSAGDLSEAEEPESAEPGPADALGGATDAGALAAALDRLPEGERELVALRFREGLSYEAIGAIQGGTVAALKQKTYRALQRLRIWLGEGGRS